MLQLRRNRLYWIYKKEDIIKIKLKDYSFLFIHVLMCSPSMGCVKYILIHTSEPCRSWFNFPILSSTHLFKLKLNSCFCIAKCWITDLIARVCNLLNKIWRVSSWFCWFWDSWERFWTLKKIYNKKLIIFYNFKKAHSFYSINLFK